MSGEPELASGGLSRRSLLRSAVGATGVLAATLNPALAQPKISKVAVNYQDHPDGDKRCGKCLQFQAPDGCKMVDGQVSAQGYCRIFMPVRQTARPQAAVAVG